MNRIKSIIVILFLLHSTTFTQVDSTAIGDIEIFVIDSYITQEQPYKFFLSFFTSDSCTAKVKLLDDREYLISDKLSDNHKIEIIIANSLYQSSRLKYYVYVKDREGIESRSQLYEVEIPKLIAIENENNLGLLQVCCFGGVIFGLPSPTVVFTSNQKYFGLSKEIPIFSFYSGGYNYPISYISAEYSHLFNSDKKNFIRVGYKHLFQIKPIEYLSLGVNYFSDFKGYNGISPEISVGLFKIQNVFTFYTRFRYNFQPDRGGTDFHEFSIGLYSNFFSLNL
ncbi:MAG: hypothetical protein GYA14_12100 [Ignavibacteria bacterium]|nr:hypothetical protein [Ignavibacteria bacterium]